MNPTAFIVLCALLCNAALAAPARQARAEPEVQERLAQVMNCVVSIASIDTAGGQTRIVATHGTAFQIGNRGFALTAKHVLAGKAKPLVAVTMGNASAWTWRHVLASEIHPLEDVAILKLEPGSCRRGFQLSRAVEMASSRYRIYGFPVHATRLESANGEFPDLVYTEGYIRRRYSASIYPASGASPPAGVARIGGSGFFELSQLAGVGTSGGPVFDLTEPLTVIGIYSAEKHFPHVIATDDKPITQLTSVAYAVRDDAFRDWQPAMLGGRTVLEESQNSR